MGLTKGVYNMESPYQLEGGASLDDVTITYHSSVESTDIAAALRAGRRVVWICHALTANSDPSEWWADLVGDGRFFDSEKDIIICANTIGSCYGSTSASNWSGKPLDFPSFSVRDIVGAHIMLRKHLGIERIDVLAGASVGGYQSLEWGVMEPDVISHLVLIACNERISPWATAFNESQRLAIEADSTFQAQESLNGGKLGLKAARTVALLSYRSSDGYNATQCEEDDDCFRALRATTYQDYQGQKLADRFDAYSYYTMTLMLDTHNVGRGRGGIHSALKRIKAKTMVIAIDSDVLFPICELRALAAAIPGAEFRDIASAFGHDGFLIEWRSLQAILTDFLKA